MSRRSDPGVAVRVRGDRGGGQPPPVESARSAGRQRAAAERSFQLVFDLSPVPQAIVRCADGRVVEVNAAWCDLLGASRDQQVGARAADCGVWSEEQLAAISSAAPSVPSADRPYDTPDGRALHLSVSCHCVDFDGGPHVLTAVTDATRAQAAEAATAESDRRKEEFLAMLSHELRNPLAPILLATRVLALRGDTPSPDLRQIIERQARHLTRMVDDLLDLSRISRGMIALHPSRVELRHVVDAALETVGPLATASGHALEVSVPEGLVLDGDEVRLAQALGNLLGNACRYTPPGGHLGVSAAIDGDEVRIEVTDDGMGVAPALLPTLFEPFVRGDPPATGDSGGLGLGLALVRRIVELHHGSVEARSAGLGEGSTFVVRLPLPVSTSRPSSGPARRRRVLLVDDNVDATELLGAVLREAGHEVHTAPNAAKGLLRAQEVVPDVALLDLGLPDMDGHALARRIRKRLGERTPVMVAVTGYGSESDRVKTKASGFQHHRVKPVDVDELLALLDSLP